MAEKTNSTTSAASTTISEAQESSISEKKAPIKPNFKLKLDKVS
jgi:hypothetical protein